MQDATERSKQPSIAFEFALAFDSFGLQVRRSKTRGTRDEKLIDDRPELTKRDETRGGERDKS